jgi:uncharacterized protein
MTTQMYVNLSVKNLNRTKEFFSSLGFAFKAEFTNDQGACMIVSDSAYVMLLAENFFQNFTPKAIADASKSTEVLVCLSCTSRAHVDELVAKAVAAGGKTPRPPQDHGFMYGHGFEDLDGHLWELMYMDPNAKPNG